MRLIYADSLGKTVDTVNEALFYGETIDVAVREATAEWIAARAGMPGAYEREMIAPMSKDIVEGFRLFTGELVNTGAGVRHILGEEACRALVLLDADDECVHHAIEGTSNAMERHLSHPQNESGFCCTRCSVAVWRNLAAGGLKSRKERLEAGMRRLRHSRSDNGRWGTYPFYYTLLTLLEIDSKEAKAEIQYSAPTAERILKHGVRGDVVYTDRRKVVLERVLALA